MILIIFTIARPTTNKNKAMFPLVFSIREIITFLALLFLFAAEEGGYIALEIGFALIITFYDTY